MKRDYKHIALLMLTWLIVSCTATDMGEMPNGRNSHYVTDIIFKAPEVTSHGDMFEEDETRNSIKYAGTWNSKPGLQNWFYKEDTLGIFPETGDQIPFPLSDVTAEATGFTFHGTGWELVDTLKYYAYFPFSRKNYKDAENINHVYVNFFGQKQENSTATVNNNVNFVRDSQCPYLYMYSLPTVLDPLTGAMVFKLQYLSGSIRFQAQLPTSGTGITPADVRIILVKIVSADSAEFVLEGTYDLDSIAKEKETLVAAGVTGENGDPMYITPTKRGKTNVLSLSYDNLAPTVSGTNLRLYGHVLLPKTKIEGRLQFNFYDSDLNWWRYEYAAGSLSTFFGGDTSYMAIRATYVGKATPDDIKVEPWDEEEETINSNWNYK